jgi:hypothetical protein
MANNYAQFSEEIIVPEDKIQAVTEFLTAYEELCQSETIDWYGGIDYTFPDKQGDKTCFWFHSDEAYTDEELLYLVQGVLKAIDDPEDKPALVSVAYTCSKPRVGEFGGGAYAIWKNDSYDLDATSAVMDYLKFHDYEPE